MYYLQNKETKRYATVTTNDVGSEVYQLFFNSGDNQRWSFTHLGDGSYSIAQGSERYLGVEDNSYSNADVVIFDEATTSGTQWYISLATSGSLKLTAKSGAGNDYVLTMSSSSVSNKVPIVQRAYVLDTEYVDEWRIVEDEYSIVHVETFYDGTYLERYPNAADRINEHMYKLRNKYVNDFGIWIEWSAPIQVISYADSCSNGIDEICDCVDRSLCVDGNIEPNHHSNYIKNAYEIPSPNINETLKIVFIGQEMCLEDESTPDADGNPAHLLANIYGLSMDEGVITITNNVSDQQAIKTLVHELGHQFGVDDHYFYHIYDENSEFSDRCIYGMDKDDEYICNNLIICDGCKAVIDENKDMFDQHL